MVQNHFKVLAFGTFDLLHPGHEYHLAKAAKYGELYVIVARDDTVENVKKRKTVDNEIQRLTNVRKLEYVHKAYLGSKKDRYSLIEKINPDIICLGYDQQSFTENLQENLAKRGINPRIIRFRKAHEPDKFKTSLMRKNGKHKRCHY